MNEDEKKAISKSKLIIKKIISILEDLLLKLDSKDEEKRHRSLWVVWCIHNYIAFNLRADAEKAMSVLGERPCDKSLN